MLRKWTVTLRLLYMSVFQHSHVDLVFQFFGCKDWFLLKGDLEDHVREDHVGSNLPIMINGQSRNICSWRGCNQALIKQTQTQVLSIGILVINVKVLILLH